LHDPLFVNYRRGNTCWLEWFRCEDDRRRKASRLDRKPYDDRDDGDDDGGPHQWRNLF
jgi:hypothetical protein